MDFMEAIEDYQVGADRTALLMVKDAMKIDFYRKVPAEGRPEQFVALACLGLLTGRLRTIKYRLNDGKVRGESNIQGNDEDLRMFYRDFAGPYRDWFGVDVTIENYPEHRAEMADYFGYSIRDADLAYKRVNTGAAGRALEIQERIVEQHWADMSKSLEYAFKRVDLSRSSREVTRYVNQATRSEYYRIQTKGMRRVRRGEGTVHVDPTFSSDVEHTILGDYVPGRYRRLSVRQRKLFDQIAEEVKADIRKYDGKDYAVDKEGLYILNNRKMAARIGIHEASLSRALRFMRKC